MKSYSRKIYITSDLKSELKERAAHIDDGISGDRLIPSDKSYSVSYNRNVVKKINRLVEFLRKGLPEELENYLKDNKEIISLDYLDGLKAYIPSDAYFACIFYEVKNRIREDEYKFLYLLPKSELDSVKNFNIKSDLDKTIEWKKEYTPTEKQKLIANYLGNNIVLGAAGTGKTDVAIHSYINHAPIDKIVSFADRDDVFITYSKKLADHVKLEIDSFWDDAKNPIKKNVYTTKDFLISILADARVLIPGYEINGSTYVKQNVKKPEDKDLLINNIVSDDTFSKWVALDCKGMNRAYVPYLVEIINKYGSDYPYLFYRGIYKGKIINKITDEDVVSYFTESLHVRENEFVRIKALLDNFASELESAPSMELFEEWYLKAQKRYANEFKLIPPAYKSSDDLYKVMEKYFDFANPLRELSRKMDYFEIFKREALLIEGYRGNTRKDFDGEVKVLYEMCQGFDAYANELYLYDDNDLCYFALNNLESIMEKGIFKCITIDEFQDMTERQIHTIVKLANSYEEHGITHIYGDFEQTINPTFLQLENIETIYMINGIDDYAHQMLSSSFRYSAAICRELEDLREMGKKLFGTEDSKGYVPLESNASLEFETGGNLLFNIEQGNEIIRRIAASKDVTNVMYITSDKNTKEELIKSFKLAPEKVFTISESKGREDDFVIAYKICTSKAQEYENLFSDDYSYSRAGRIFYNQLYVGITRCKVNFLEIEDGNLLGVKTKEALTSVIAPLLEENIKLFTEEIVSQKTNYYFLARDSFKNFDFAAARDNLSFYSGEDFDNLAKAIDLIDAYNLDKSTEKELAGLANSYKEKARYDLARVIYTVIANDGLLALTDIALKEKDLPYTDEYLREVILANKDSLCDCDIKALEDFGYFERKKSKMLERIKKINPKEAIKK